MSSNEVTSNHAAIPVLPSTCINPIHGNGVARLDDFGCKVKLVLPFVGKFTDVECQNNPVPRFQFVESGFAAK